MNINYDYFADSISDDGDNLYMAPEVLSHQPYNEKVDIFSFGIILRLLFTGSAVVPHEQPCREEEYYPSIIDDGPNNYDHSNFVVEPTRICSPIHILTGTILSIVYRRYISTKNLQYMCSICSMYVCIIHS